MRIGGELDDGDLVFRTVGPAIPSMKETSNTVLAFPTQTARPVLNGQAHAQNGLSFTCRLGV